jgi:hypothetical protein
MKGLIFGIVFLTGGIIWLIVLIKSKTHYCFDVKKLRSLK